MDYLIRLIVTADDAKEAKLEAERIMDELVEWHDFDSYTTAYGESRWDNCWNPQKLSSKEAQAMAANAMAEQREVFDETISRIRTMLSLYSDEQIFNEDFVKVGGNNMSRHLFTKAGGHHGNASRLFDNYGDVILSQRQLDMYLREANGLWVVQVDACN